MKTQNSIIATMTVITVMIMALLTSFTASANVYEDRLQTAFDDIINAVSLDSRKHLVSIYSNPATGIKEGQLDVYKFTIGRDGMGLIEEAQKIYEQVNGNSNADVYTLWINDNGEWNTQGYRIYYNPDETIVVGLACDHCYTVGFVAPGDKQHRKTYTLEWSTPDDYSDSISGRIITTYAPIKAKAGDGHRISSVVINTDNLDKLMEQMQNEGMEKYQKELEKTQKKLEKAQAKLDDALSKLQNKSSSFSSSSSSSSSNSGSSHVIKGKVTDPNGEPLIGATVQAIGPLGPGNGTATDINGEFTLTVPDNVKQIKVSYVGYKTQVLPVQPNMVTKMDNDDDQLDELQDLFLRPKPGKDNDNLNGKNNSKSWMKQLLFYIEKIQQSSGDNRYLYLSKLYELCKDTDGLDQTDLKIGMQQLASVYKQLKEKKKLKDNELIFLESMVDLLENKTKSIHSWNPD